MTVEKIICEGNSPKCERVFYHFTVKKSHKKRFCRECIRYKANKHSTEHYRRQHV